MRPEFKEEMIILLMLMAFAVLFGLLNVLAR